MAGNKPKLVRMTTVPMSLRSLLKGQLRFMSDYFDVLAISSDDEDFEDMLRELGGVRGVKIHMERHPSPLRDLKALFLLVRLFRRERPTIVHTHTPKAGLLGMMAARLTGVPLRLHTTAGLPLLVYKGFKRQVLDAMERLTNACATRVFPNSFRMMDIMREKKLCRPDKMEVIAQGSSNGIDTKHFAPEALLLPGETPADARARLRREFGLPADGFVFVFVGRIVGDKGMNELATAMRALAGRCKLLLVGPLEPELDPLQPESLKTFTESTDVSAVGMQRDVRPYLLAADALVFPSYREGFPNVVLQAGAMGLPAIVTDINGCNEIIRDGENGVIIPPGDAEALVRAMQCFIDRPERVRDMAARAREMITSRYRQQDVWDALLARYREMLQQRR